MNPLFFPLKTQYYEAFENGSKHTDLRRYGNGIGQFNEDKCPIGREVTISHGYGKKRRMHGRVSSFEKVYAADLSPEYICDVVAVYGTTDIEIACIGIEF